MTTKPAWPPRLRPYFAPWWATVLAVAVGGLVLAIVQPSIVPRVRQLLGIGDSP